MDGNSLFDWDGRLLNITLGEVVGDNEGLSDGFDLGDIEGKDESYMEGSLVGL